MPNNSSDFQNMPLGEIKKLVNEKKKKLRKIIKN